MDFYLILQEIMKEKDLNIPAVARKCGLSDGTIRSIIKREQKNVTLDVAFRLYRGLNVSLERLNGEQEKAPANVANALEKRLVDNFNKLNKDGQSMLCELSQVLVDSKRYCKPVEVAARGGHQVDANQVGDLDDLLPPDAIHE